jgi:hypothetical protein
VAELKPVEAPPRREIVTVVRAIARAAHAATSPSAAPDVGAPERTACAAPAGFLENLVDANTPCIDAHAPTSREDRERVEPLSADLRRLHVTVSRRLLEKLEAARDALSHARPDASTNELLEAGLDLLLADCAKRKGLGSKPRKERRAAKDDHIPAEVRRAVLTRDEGKCQWSLQCGGICGSTRRVQLDHRHAKARGGPPTIENLRVLCAFHNDLAARLEYGDELMDHYTGPAARKRRRRRS